MASGEDFAVSEGCIIVKINAVEIPERRVEKGKVKLRYKCGFEK